MGSDADNQPLIGIRREFETGDDFAPGYFALIDGASVATDKFVVRGNELVSRRRRERDDFRRWPKLRAAGWVGGRARWMDSSSSPLGDLWKQVEGAGLQKFQDKGRDIAKAAMATLYQAMMMEPGLSYG